MMVINSQQLNPVSISVSHESGITFKSVNDKTFAIDYGISTDHLTSNITIHGTETEIKAIQSYLLTKNQKTIIIDTDQKIFGPAYNDISFSCLLTKVGDLVHDGKGLFSLNFTVVTNPQLNRLSPIPFSFNGLSVQSVTRALNKSINPQTLLSGNLGNNHNWQRPELEISCKGKTPVVGGMLSWLANRRAVPFALSCNTSMTLIDNQSDNVICTGYNITQDNNLEWWSITFNFVRV